MNFDIDEKTGQVQELTPWQLAVIEQNRTDATINRLEDLYPREASSLKELIGTVRGSYAKGVGPFTGETYQSFIKKTLEDLQDLIRRKQADYTNGKGPFANFDQSADFGVDPFKGVMVRLGDKVQRIKSYCSTGELQVKDEGIEDAFKDLIGYSLIALAMLDEKKRDVR